MQSYNPKRLLVPTDFSQLATAALDYAVELSEKFNASIVLLYAEPFDRVGLPLDLYVSNFPSFQNLADEKLRQFVARELPPTIPYQIVVSTQNPASAIVAAAKEHDVDLIVMGTHGRRGLRRAFLGSVSEEVLKYTDRPVLTVCKTEVPLPPMEPLFSRIVCPVNGTDIARRSVEHAASIATAFDAALYVVNVDEDSAARHDQIRSWIGEELYDRCVDEEAILSGDPAEEILRFAEQNRADLLVIGAQHRRFVDTTVVGTTSERLIRFARCPILTVTRPVDVPRTKTRVEEVAARVV